MSEEGSKDLLVGDEGHNLARAVACGAPLLTTNADHISGELLDGNRLISNQLNFPGKSLWVSPVVSIIAFDLVEAI